MWHIFHKDILALAVLRPEISYCKTRICVWFNQRSETLDDGSLFFFAILNWHLSNNTIFVPCRNSNSIWYFFLLSISQPRPALFSSVHYNSSCAARCSLYHSVWKNRSSSMSAIDRWSESVRTHEIDRSWIEWKKQSTIWGLKWSRGDESTWNNNNIVHAQPIGVRCLATRNRKRKVPTAQVELLNN